MIGVLCIHGFTGSPKEIEPLVQYLSEQTDWMIRTPTLPGHGSNLQLKGIRYESWIQHAEQELEALKKCCEKIYICGFSMGGLIGSWLASRHSIDKLVLLSAAAYYTNPKKLLKDFRYMFTKRHEETVANEKFNQFKYKMRATPLSAYIQFVKLVQSVRPAISKVEVPTFIIQGKEDPIVPEKSAKFLYENISTKEKKLMLIEEANHMICYGHYQNQMFRNILTFLNDGYENEKIAMTQL